jgi:hypothetical protein
MSPLALALAGVVALVVLIPTRRLRLRGWSRDAVTTYFGLVWLLGVVVATIPAPARLLVPVLLVAYLAPFVTWREGLDRLRGGPGPAPRTRGRPPAKNVTPPDPPGDRDR